MTELKTLNDLGSNAGLGCERLCSDFCNKYEEAQAEIRKLRELCREAYHELNCGEDGDVFDRTHACGKCDSSIDRNGTLRGKLALAFVMVPNSELRGARDDQ